MFILLLLLPWVTTFSSSLGGGVLAGVRLFDPLWGLLEGVLGASFASLASFVFSALQTSWTVSVCTGFLGDFPPLFPMGDLLDPLFDFWDSLSGTLLMICAAEGPLRAVFFVFSFWIGVGVGLRLLEWELERLSMRAERRVMGEGGGYWWVGLRVLLGLRLGSLEGMLLQSIKNRSDRIISAHLSNTPFHPSIHQYQYPSKDSSPLLILTDRALIILIRRPHLTPQQTGRQNRNNRLFLTMSDSLGPSTYQPFKYPPDYELALLHQRCSMPGKPDLSQAPCPCCKQHPRIPFSNWWGRSIERDFKDYGGAIVSYFWLLKLYILAVAVVIAIYGIYLQYLTQHYCNALEDPIRKLQVCGNLFGLWIIGNSDLHDLISEAGDREALVRFGLLRTMVFLVLLATCIAALYIMRWFKVRYPDRIGVAHFSLLFKNLPSPNLEDLISRLRSQFGEFQLKEGFIVKKIEPFYSAYQEKLQKYYRLKIEPDPKKQLKLQKEVDKLDRFCQQHEDEYYHCGRRAILVFHSREVRDQIFRRYSITRWENFKLFFNNQYSEEREVYCEACPKPEEMLWNNLGKAEKEGCRVKVKSIAYFFLSLGGFYLLLFFALQIIYIDNLREPLKTVIQFVILLVISFFSIVFRRIMDKLSELRFPNTYTERTMFIVMTTVVFHYLFYLFIPNIYLSVEVDRRGDVLKCISSQTITFALMQIVLAGVDIMHCLWNRRRGAVEDESRPIGCQKILHAQIEYPRYPIEFKLIVTFKFWSLMTFFSFHTPLVLLILLPVLIFVYVKDKYNLYLHFRMEVIHNQVQLKFLRFYTNIFVVYMFIIYIATQHDTLEYVVGGIVVAAVIVFQNVYFRREPKSEEEDDAPKTLDDLDQGLNLSYMEKYNSFLEVSKSEKVDKAIKEELYGAGFSSINTDEEITAKFLN